MNRKVCCDICGTELGMIDTDKVSVPLKAEMFSSMDVKHEIPPPFLPGQEWLDFRCLQCKHRPFHEPDQITLINDNYSKEIFKILPQPTYACEKCGKEYQHKSSLSRHRSNCNA